MLLGAVVPELRSATEALASDLAELTRLRGAVAQERDTLAQRIVALGSERVRLAALVEVRQAAEVAAEGSLDQDRQHAADLARQATNLRDLVSRLESEVASARRAADAARAADEARQKAAEADADAVRAKVAAGATRDPARLAPAVAFADEKGRMSLPAAGTMIRNFGSSDSYGGQEHGMSLATRPAIGRLVAGRRLDLVLRPLPLLWTAFNYQWRRRLLYRARGLEWNQRGTRAVRPRGGTCRYDGGWVGQDGRRDRAWRSGARFFMLNSGKTGRRSTRAHGG